MKAGDPLIQAKATTTKMPVNTNSARTTWNFSISTL